MKTSDLQAKITEALPLITQSKEQLNTVIVGQEILIERLLQTLLVKGHILLEGVPGLAKTTAITTLAEVCKVAFQRVQFTPDLLPSDLLGSRIYSPKTQEFSVKKGPIFHNFILADEINRSPAKVQSALLEAMAERQVTIGDKTFPLPKPFFVLATQNPIEQEGTYPLPEAQVDRFFFKVVLDYPTPSEETQILKRIENWKSIKTKSVLTPQKIQELQSLTNEIFIDDTLYQYIVDIISTTRDPKRAGLEEITNLIAFGASPRGSICLLQGAKSAAFLAGRAYVIPEDIKSIAFDVLRHRVMPHYEAQAEGITSVDLITKILNTVKVP